MPATDFKWSSLPHTPIFQVFGTKRKVENEMSWDPASMDVQQVSSLQQMDQMAKRKCVRSASELQQQQLLHQQQQLQLQQQQLNGLPPCQVQVPMGLPDPACMTEVNQNHLSGPPPIQDSPDVQIPPPLLFNNVPLEQQDSQGAAADCSLMTDHFLPNCVPWPAPDFQQQHHQNDQIMNMEDETYSAHQVCETQAAHQTMDSDCTPNPAQYAHSNTTPQPSSTRPPSPPENRSGVPCSEYCGMGDDTLMSNRVRCYCKPSWEGLMYLRPYISDIY